jgi:hypothetical protein
MNIKTIAASSLVIIALFSLYSCNSMTNEAFLATVDTMLMQGKITMEQANTLKEAAAAAMGTGEWPNLLMGLAQTGLDVALALLGVRMWRGGINTRKGNVAQ